jgi:Ca2+-binding EF-hand superfamily protein
MKKLILAGTALAALLAVPALAQRGDEGRDGPIAPRTRAQVEAAVQARFARADADHDGFVTREEVRARVEAARPDREGGRDQRRGQMFDRLDADHDGSISRAEFDARPAFRGGEPGRRFARRGGGMGGGLGGRLFERLDSDRDGRVALAEAERAALERFDRVDSNRDGSISPEERQAAREAFRERMQERHGD